MFQWWYGHNAVGFFLTAGFLAIMYYFIPKRAERPVYSYRLSIIHFWSLIFLYIWAGPHHLHYTALPDWAQTLGMTFSIMLWMPSWGGMINGLMTLSGAWDKLRTDPVLRMLVVSVAFYGMSTFEGPMMSIKVVNSLSHYTDWTIGHVHSGALGWVGFVSFGALYCLVPWLWNRKGLYSLKLVNWHFWISTIGIVLYISAMWVSGILQGLMWRAYTSLGFLEYSFIETVEAMHPFYIIRAAGGALFLIGALIMAYNLWMTVRVGRSGSAVARRSSAGGIRSAHMSFWTRHQIFEKNSIVLIVGILAVIAIGGLVEITPLFYLKSTIEKVDGVRPYTPLELAGRNIYVREGCYLCHSQMIRPLRDEVERYGHYSLAAESMYDHPFQWGSKRTGPDLARVGGKYSDDWHVTHLTNPRAIVPQSVMPGYPFLAETEVDGDQHRRPSAHQPHRRRALYATTRSPMPPPISRRRPIPTTPATMRSRSAIRRRWCATSTASRAIRPRWMRWSPICRCSARWSISSSTTKKQTALSNLAERARTHESNPHCPEHGVGLRHDVLDAGLRRHLHRHPALRALAPQQGHLRRSGENAAARGLILS